MDIIETVTMTVVEEWQTANCSRPTNDLVNIMLLGTSRNILAILAAYVAI